MIGRLLVGTLVACLVVMPRAARGQGHDSSAISQAIKTQWEGAKQNIRESADQFAEADYAFRPVESVRTVGQMLAHVAGANYVFCAAARGERSPHPEDQFEKTLKAKADIVKALADSFAYCDPAYSGLNDMRAAEMIAEPFGTGRSARAAALMGNTGHLQEHYGNLVTYFRIKGMVPPSSRR
jgi:uncharacterized damage-inducible protein DinB